MKPIKIVSHKDPVDSYAAYIEFGGSSPNDGTRFTLVEVEFSDGNMGHAYICNCLPGYFRNIFVRWESPMPMVPEK